MRAVETCADSTHNAACGYPEPPSCHSRPSTPQSSNYARAEGAETRHGRERGIEQTLATSIEPLLVPAAIKIAREKGGRRL